MERVGDWVDEKARKNVARIENPYMLKQLLATILDCVTHGKA